VSSSLPIDAVVDYIADIDRDGVAVPGLLTVLGRIVDPGLGGVCGIAWSRCWRWW
jgi:hypothetical protein